MRSSTVRYSRVLKNLDEDGAHDVAKKIRESFERVSQTCEKHGALPDPVIAMHEDGRLMFACPWCCGCAVREWWEADAEQPWERALDKDRKAGVR